MSSPYQLDTSSTPYDHQLLVIYSLYRLALSLVLWAVFLSGDDLGHRLPGLFIIANGIYGAVNIALLYSSVKQWQPKFWPLIAIITSDILAIQLTLVSSGNTGTGLYTSMLASVAAGSLFLPVRTFLVIPAIATISLLAGTISNYSGQTETIVFSGWMGALFFAAGILLHVLRQRIEQGNTATLHEKARVRHLQQLNNLIIERMHTGIMVIDNNGYILSYNRATQELLKFDKPDSPTTNATGQWPLKNLASLDDSLWRSVTSSTKSADESARVKFGNAEKKSRITINYKGQSLQFTWLLLANSSNDNTESPTDILIFIEDLAKIAQQAQQLKLSSLGKLTASIAHEIRNPLGAVSHAAQLLALEHGKNDGDYRKLTEIIVRQSARCSDVIDSVLNISRSHKAQIKRFELLPWLQDFLNDFSLANDGEITVIGNYPQAVRFDPAQLSQVLTNLLNNALRHSTLATDQRSATIIISQDRQLKPQIDVCDLGKGVDKENRSQLFEPFFSTVNGGNGLGLYLCRELCEANQATISYADWTLDLPPDHTNLSTNIDHFAHSFRVLLPHPAREQRTD